MPITRAQASPRSLGKLVSPRVCLWCRVVVVGTRTTDTASPDQRIQGYGYSGRAWDRAYVLLQTSSREDALAEQRRIQLRLLDLAPGRVKVSHRTARLARDADLYTVVLLRESPSPPPALIIEEQTT